MKMREIVLLLSILVGAFLVRLYQFDAPIADWHSWRQADTSSVSRIFTQEGFDILHPRFHDLSNVPSGLNNPDGYRFVEFPIFNILQAGGYAQLDMLTLEEWGRVVSIFASVASTLFLYLIVTRHANSLVGFLSASFFAFLPFNIFYGRVILPDPSMVATTLGSIYFFDKWVETEKVKNKSEKGSLLVNFLFLSLSILFGATSLLLKPFAIFFFLPMIVFAYNSFGLNIFKKWQLYVFAILVIVPFLLWRWWMLQYPEGIPVNDWLFNGGNIRFKGAYFYWIFADRIGRLILGYFGVALLVLGILAAGSKQAITEKKDSIFVFSFLVSTLLYVVIVARGNVQHDYYQIPIIPSLAIFLGFGSYLLLKPRVFNLNKYLCYGLFTICTLFTFVFGWYHVRDYFNINNPNIVIAGEVVDTITPKDAKVITFYDGDTSFLYQTKRKGWSSLQSSLPEMIDLGATHLAIVNPTEKDFTGLGNEYEVVAQDPKYLILKLE